MEQPYESTSETMAIAWRIRKVLGLPMVTESNASRDTNLDHPARHCPSPSPLSSFHLVLPYQASSPQFNCIACDQILASIHRVPSLRDTKLTGGGYLPGDPKLRDPKLFGPHAGYFRLPDKCWRCGMVRSTQTTVITFPTHYLIEYKSHYFIEHKWRSPQAPKVSYSSPKSSFLHRA